MIQKLRKFVVNVLVVCAIVMLVVAAHRLYEPNLARDKHGRHDQLIKWLAELGFAQTNTSYTAPQQ